MNVLEFIAWIFTVIMGVITIIGVNDMKYKNRELKEENQKLLDDLNKASFYKEEF